MPFINSLKFTKTKTISTVIFATVEYFIMRFIAEIGCTEATYLDITDYSAYSILPTCGSMSLNTLINSYLFVIIPIALFYIIYSFIQYNKSK